MRLARVRVGTRLRTAAVLVASGGVALLPERLGTVDDIVRGGQSTVDAARAAVPGAPVLPLDRVGLTTPLSRFNRDILCTGWNYLAHFQESQGAPAELPEHPAFFTKGPDTVIGPNDDIAYDPAISQMWDYEAELAVIIGREGRSIPEERALEYVFGYCVANDVSQRDLQRAHGGQWLKGKSIDGTMPLGPWVTVATKVPDPRNLRITCELNGTMVQDASTAQMAFPIERLIAELSWGMTLRPGDVLLTGTPSGVGDAREPQLFLRDGDTLTTSIAGLGTLRNRVSRTALVAAR